MHRGSFAIGWILPFAFSIFSFTEIFAAEVLELPIGIEDANLKIIQILSKVDPEKYIEDEKTYGFNYKYKSATLSPFQYKVYIGRMSQRSADSILRIESSDKGQEKVWKQIFEAELLKNPQDDEVARRLESKSYLASLGLNLIQPSFSVMYNSWESPFLTVSDTVWASSFYILADILLVGGAYAYASAKAHRKTIWENLLNEKGPPPILQGPDAGAVLGALAVTRLYRMFGSIQDTRAHNRMVELEYRFRF